MQHLPKFVLLLLLLLLLVVIGFFSALALPWLHHMNSYESIHMRTNFH